MRNLAKSSVYSAVTLANSTAVQTGMFRFWETEAELVCPRVRDWASTHSDGLATLTLASVYKLLYVKRLRA